MQVALISPVQVPTEALHEGHRNVTHSSAVSWAAVAGGAFVAASLSLILLSLGTGLGLSSISPWTNAGVSRTTLGFGAIVWLIGMQVIAFGMGGYLAGHLRTKWVDVHSDEVFFRDTAHGFLVWAVSVAITASFLTSAAATMVSGGAQLGATALAAPAGNAGAIAPADPNRYFVDELFRSTRPSVDAADAATRAEVGRIFTASLLKGDPTLADRTYVAQLVVARTGLSQPDADKRVSDVIAQAKSVAADAEATARDAADKARKAAANLALWIFVALLVGAFSASYSATIGASHRQYWPAV